MKGVYKLGSVELDFCLFAVGVMELIWHCLLVLLMKCFV
jgi:hypothetical protein